jgi:hypothetical protein
MREAEFSLVALPGNLKHDVSAIPFGLVLNKVDAGVRDMPDDFFAGHQFGDLVGAAVKVFVVELKLCAEFVGAAFDLFRPPPTDVVDGVPNP